MYFSVSMVLIFMSLGRISSASKGYNRSLLMEKYPELGENFVMFPDGDSNIKMGHMNHSNLPKNLIRFHSDISKDVTFTLYTRKHPEGKNISNFTDLTKHNFATSKKTNFVTHGWMSSGQEGVCVSIKDAYLNKSDVNVFIVDWSPIADTIFYSIPESRTTNVGMYLSSFLRYLVAKLKMNPKKIHLVGHSLGAHVSGVAGRYLKHGKVGRITGLDPALPGYGDDSSEEHKLSKNDSDFVDVIHTCGGFLGIDEPVGHADFYPNGGDPPQPNCTILEVLETCSHSRSWRLFAESIKLDEPFLASKCPSFDDMSAENCTGAKVPMGDPTPKNARGVFYLETTGKKPYIKNGTT